MSEEEKQIHLYMHSKNELGLATLCVEKDKEIERLKREKDIVIKLNHFVSNEIKRILEDDELCHIEKLQEIAKVVGVDKE